MNNNSVGGINWDALGPSLLALGAGLAAGGAPGGGGWGRGISLGLAGVADAQRNRAELAQRQQAYALQLAQLQDQQAYQNASLAISQQNADTNQEARTQAAQDRRDRLQQLEAGYAGPVNMIAAVAPQYGEIRDTLISPQPMGSWTQAAATGGGNVGRSLSMLKSAVYGAAQLDNKNPEQVWETLRPTGPEDAAEKLTMIENYISGLGGSLGQYETLKTPVSKFSLFTAPGQQVAKGTQPPPAGPAQANVSGMPDRVGGGAGMIPPSAVRYLKSNPQTRAAFEQKYGVSADAFLR